MNHLLHEITDGENRVGSVDSATAVPSSDIASSLPAAMFAHDRLVQVQPAARALLEQLVDLRLLTPDRVRRFLDAQGEQAARYTTAEMLGNALVQGGQLTSYQMDRLQAGTTYGLVLGSYRVLDRLGAGGMGVVFVGEHYLMQRRVAIKVLRVDEDCPELLLKRFYAEMRALADLHHPHIVQAFDAGELAPPQSGTPGLIYLVMELITGGDLEQYVLDHGPLPITQACHWIHQAACGLQEAHDRHLIHRDVKPSNLMLTAQGQVKLGDFGLARQFSSQLTDPGAVLGTVDFMAPEQSYDATAVGQEADIYGLGATLFWLLTGEPPYPPQRYFGPAMRALQQNPPRRLRTLRPDAPEELESLIDRMMDRNPARRPALALLVMNSLAPFLTAQMPRQEGPGSRSQETSTDALLAEADRVLPGASCFPKSPEQQGRILIVEDEPATRQLMRLTLEPLGYMCGEASDGDSALRTLRQEVYDLALLDLNLAGRMDGFEVCQRLRERPPCPHFKVMIISGRGDPDELAESLPRGADDYIPKPFRAKQLVAKVHHLLDLKRSQEQTHLLAHHLMVTNRQFEQTLQARAADVTQAQDALIFAMAKMAELPNEETPQHLRRLQLYTRCLAEAAGREPGWNGLIDEPFLECLERCVPLHDIGMIGLPAALLLKPGPLSASERTQVEMHTIVGDRILEALGREHGRSLTFLSIARAIARHHHERYDGTGYPDRLASSAIPLAARLVAFGDVYDALRCRRVYKAALAHAAALDIMLEHSVGQFDPDLLQVFSGCAARFEQIFSEWSD